jgi:alkaline phosphatase
VKWRNQLLALFCLLAFAGAGVLYFQHWVIQKPFGIILFVGEGLSPGRLAATRLYAAGADTHLSLDSMNSVALLTNYSNDFAAPDQAAAATALATGVKVNNRAIGVDPEGRALQNIVELAREHGRATGLVADTNLTDPTAAAFYAHTTDLNDRENIALELVASDKLDLVLGGGASDFLPQSKQGSRRDQRDLLLELRRNGFDIVRSKAELEAIPRWRRPRLLGVFSKAELPYVGEVAVGSEHPSLADMVRRAIELLQFNPSGYLLIVDSGLMRKAAQENDGERTLAEIVAMDRALAVARDYVGRKSTILVSGDCAIGGLSVNGFPFRKDSGVALLGLNSTGYPWLTWATGPHGPKRYGPAKIADSNGSNTSQHESADAQQPLEPAAIYAQDAFITVDDVVVFGSGPGTENLRGIMDSTIVFKIIRDNL